MSEWHEKGLREAVSSTLGWAGVVFATVIVGFCAGYWIGHREITALDQTVQAFLWLPFLWLGFRQVLVAYVVTALAFYLPLRSDLARVRITAAGVNLVTWFVIILWIVEQSKDSKFFRF
jgi:hypothetical protein